jgi:hypothetical protein
MLSVGWVGEVDCEEITRRGVKLANKVLVSEGEALGFSDNWKSGGFVRNGGAKAFSSLTSLFGSGMPAIGKVG